jgi:hypothetical protein
MLRMLSAFPFISEMNSDFECLPARLLQSIGLQKFPARRKFPNPPVEAFLLHASGIEARDEDPQAVAFLFGFID